MFFSFLSLFYCSHCSWWSDTAKYIISKRPFSPIRSGFESKVAARRWNPHSGNVNWTTRHARDENCLRAFDVKREIIMRWKITRGQVPLSGYECFSVRLWSSRLPPPRRYFSLSLPFHLFLFLYLVNLFLTIANIFPNGFFLFFDTRHALKMRIKDTHAHVDANKNKCSVHYLVRELLISIHGSPLQARWKLFFIHQIYREICQYKPPCFRTHRKFLRI